MNNLCCRKIFDSGKVDGYFEKILEVRQKIDLVESSIISANQIQCNASG
jgi:hypothetical protein